jgi:mRNA interferase RelE/StbE
MFQIFIEKRAQKEFSKIPTDFQFLVRKKILELKQFPELSNIKRLESTETRDTFRLRVGDFRVVFVVFSSEKIIRITYIRRRNERTYKDL